MATSGLTGGMLQCVFVDGAVLILDVTNEDRVFSIVEPVLAR